MEGADDSTSFTIALGSDPNPCATRGAGATIATDVPSLLHSRVGLPIVLSRFIGREREMAAVRGLLERSRLVTLTGVGGSGKTRLAIQVAQTVELPHGNNVAFIDLAPLSERSLVPQAFAQALGMIETSRSDIADVVVAHLADADALLVVDNCEHVIDTSAELLERLLTHSPNLRVLATSRQPLDIEGEAVFQVPPLAIPQLASAGSPTSLVDVADFDAVRLFIERAGGARNDFVMDRSNADAVARICVRLDGLPLAIELAAVRLRWMSAEEILQRLDDRFSLLARRGRATIARHRTLRATIDWSHGLLTDNERRLFRRLSVFASDWALADVEGVCSWHGLDGGALLDVHGSLVDRSLVVREADAGGPARFRFLETIRHYASEQLADAAEDDAMRARHFAHFLALAEGYYVGRMAGGSDAGLKTVAAYRDDFRAALSWSVVADPEGCLRLTAALDDFWRMVGAAEGWGWLQRTLGLVARDSPHRVRALLTAGMLSAYVPAYAEGAGLLGESIAGARAVGDRVSEAWAELWLGRLALFGDDPAAAGGHLERALAAHEDVGNRLGRVRSLALLGLLEGLVLERHDDGRRRLEHAIRLAREAEDGWGEGYAHVLLALCAVNAGHRPDAKEHALAALDAPSLGPILGVPIQTIARLAVDRDASVAARLLGAAAGHFERTGTLEPPFVRRLAERTRERAVDLMGADAAGRAEAGGRFLSSDAAIQLARSWAMADGPDAALTPRETQVASLVAAGRTNRDIAASLYISVRTAESHVQHILTKIGLSNRTQLAAWVRANSAENP